MRMPHILVAAIAATLAIAAPAAAEPSWAPAASAPVHPGVGATLDDSLKLHTKGGWRDHSDGNRITTTYGDKVEVIRGNYKMIVLGRQDSLVPELETLVAAHPYREGLRAQLMLALYRSGRQAEALETYRRARRTFSEELGIEPGPRLRELEGAILRHDSSLETPRPVGLRTRAEESIEMGRQQRRLPARRTLALATALVLATAAALVWAARDPSGGVPAPVELVGDSVAVIDPGTDTIVGEIQRIKEDARRNGFTERPRWPMIVLRTPKGWTCPKEIDGRRTEDYWRSHQVPMGEMHQNRAHVRILEEWMKQGKLNNVSPGEPSMSTADVDSFLEAGHAA